MQSYGVSLLVLAGAVILLTCVTVCVAMVTWALDFIDRGRERFNARRQRRAELRGVLSR